MPGCAAQPASAGIISSVSAFVDCQTETFVVGAYQSLAVPGSTLSVLLTGFLTIAIALFGYNLLLGNIPSLRGGMMTMAKVGIVFALATSWPAYHTLIYDLTVNGPDQLAAELGYGSRVPGSDGTLRNRLDAVDAAMVQLAILGPGPYTPDAQSAGGAAVPPPPFMGFNGFALGSARIVFLLVSLGSLIAVRTVAGLALALGPFFVAFLLFANTRSLFEGWIRVLAGAAISSLVVLLTLGLELTLIEPWIAQAIAIRTADQPLPSMPSELLVISLLFGLVVGAGIFAAMRLVGAFRLSPIMLERLLSAEGSAIVDRRPSLDTTRRSQDGSDLTRSAALAEHLHKSQARDLIFVAARRSGQWKDSDTVRTSPSVAGGGTISGTASQDRRRSSRRTMARETATAKRRDTHP